MGSARKEHARQERAAEKERRKVSKENRDKDGIAFLTRSAMTADGRRSYYNERHISHLIFSANVTETLKSGLGNSRVQKTHVIRLVMEAYRRALADNNKTIARIKAKGFSGDAAKLSAAIQSGMQLLKDCVEVALDLWAFLGEDRGNVITAQVVGLLKRQWSDMADFEPLLKNILAGHPPMRPYFSDTSIAEAIHMKLEYADTVLCEYDLCNKHGCRRKPCCDTHGCCGRCPNLAAHSGGKCQQKTPMDPPKPTKERGWHKQPNPPVQESYSNSNNGYGKKKQFKKGWNKGKRGGRGRGGWGRGRGRGRGRRGPGRY